MVNVYESDAEQIEQLKRIWREYGIAIVIGIVLAVIVGATWRIYIHHRERTLAHASMRYEQLLTNVVNGNTSDVALEANRLMNRYPNTPYASLAALQLARQDIYIANLPDAEDKLRWVFKSGSSPALREIARIRLARVLLAENHPQQALDLLSGGRDSSFAAAAWEIKGDALLALGKPADAKIAYKNALSTFPGIEVIRPLLQMKLDNLASATDVAGNQS